MRQSMNHVYTYVWSVTETNDSTRESIYIFKCSTALVAVEKQDESFGYIKDTSFHWFFKVYELENSLRNFNSEERLK